jgi:hypothetical protein
MRSFKLVVALVAGVVVALGGLSASADAAGRQDLGQGRPTHVQRGGGCPRGETMTNGVCSCPVGKIKLRDGCVKPGACPPGETKNNGVCSCPAGDEMIRGRCVSPTACPPPGQFANGQCVATPTCPSSYHLKNGQCVTMARKSPGRNK